MTKSFLMYLEGDPANVVKCDRLVGAIPLMKKRRGYDSIIIGNMYHAFYDTRAQFDLYFEAILKVIKDYGLSFIPSVHNDLSPIWGNAIYTNQELTPFAYSNDKTWEYYFQRVKLLKSYLPEMQNVYMDLEDPFWAHMNSPVFSMRSVCQIAMNIMGFFDRCLDIGVTPILYDVYPRFTDSGVPRFTQIEQALVPLLSDSNIIFGDPSTYSNPNRAPAGWAKPFTEYVKQYPGDRSHVMWMGIEYPYNAQYGYTPDEWDNYVALNNIPWSALFGEMPPL